SRSAAAPSAPTSSKSPTDAAMPSCTHVIEATAMPAPALAGAGAGDGVSWGMRPVQREQLFMSRSSLLTNRSDLADNGPVNLRPLELLLELSRRRPLPAARAASGL